MLANMFATAFHHSPAANIWMVSLVKVEKVLNPPQKPAINNTLAGPPNFPLTLRPTSKPKTKQASTLAKSVAHGKDGRQKLIA